MRKKRSLSLLLILWAIAWAAPGWGQEAVLRPLSESIHPLGAHPLPSSRAGARAVFLTPSAVLHGEAVLPYDGAALWSSAGEGAVALLTVADAASPHDRRFVFYVEGPERPWGVRHERVLPVDTPHPVVAPSSKGGLVYALPATAEVTFVDPDGRVVREVALFKETAYTLERSVLLAHDPGTGDVFVSAMPRPAGASGANAGGDAETVVLFRFGADGALRWRLPLPLPSVHALSVDPRGRFVAVAGVDVSTPAAPVFSTTLVDAGGAVRRVLPDGFDRASWSEDASELLLLTPRRAAWFDLATGEARSRIEAPGDAQRWVDAALAPAGGQAVLVAARSVYRTGGFAYEDARLYGLGPAGTARALAEDPAQERSGAHLSLAPSGDGTFALVRDQRTRYYRWEDVR